jgi:hypothetical protein
MPRRIAILALAGCISCGLAFEDACVAEPELTAPQIVEKNIAARGGLNAWRKVQSMTWIGYLESTSASAPSLPFSLEMKRPNKERFEVRTQSQPTVRMYDGTSGWTLRPARDGKPELEPFTREELDFAHDEQVIDGPLIDYAAKGNSITLENIDEIDGRKAYRLSVRLPSGSIQHVWIDAQNFLDIKYDREFHDRLGRTNTVTVFYRNYQTIDGLQVPLVIENTANNGRTTERIVIAKILLNPPLDNQMFTSPGTPGQHERLSISRPYPRADQPFRSTIALPSAFSRPGFISKLGSTGVRQ